jgi:hypothetical protein
MQATHPGCAGSSDESEEDTSLGLLSDSSLEEEKEEEEEDGSDGSDPSPPARIAPPRAPPPAPEAPAPEAQANAPANDLDTAPMNVETKHETHRLETKEDVAPAQSGLSAVRTQEYSNITVVGDECRRPEYSAIGLESLDKDHNGRIDAAELRGVTLSAKGLEEFDANNNGTIEGEEVVKLLERGYLYTRFVNHLKMRDDATRMQRVCIGAFRSSALCLLLILLAIGIVLPLTTFKFEPFGTFANEELFITPIVVSQYPDDGGGGGGGAGGGAGGGSVDSSGSAIDTCSTMAARTSNAKASSTRLFSIQHTHTDSSESWRSLVRKESWANVFVISVEQSCAVGSALSNKNATYENATTNVSTAYEKAMSSHRVIYFDYPAMRKMAPWFLRSVTLGALDFKVLELTIVMMGHIPMPPNQTLGVSHLSAHILSDAGLANSDKSKMYARADDTWFGISCSAQARGAPSQFRVAWHSGSPGWNCTHNSHADPLVDVRRPFVFIFAVLNSGIACGVTFWALRGSQHMAERAAKKMVKGVGREYFDKQFAQRYRREQLQKGHRPSNVMPLARIESTMRDLVRPRNTHADRKHEGDIDIVAVNPLFLFDCLVADTPVLCEVSVVPAIRSTLLHFAMIVVPTLPLILLALMKGCQRTSDAWDLKKERGDDGCALVFIDVVVMGVAILQYASWAVFALAWHVNIRKWAQRALLRCAFAALTLSLALSSFYLVNVFMWLCLVLLINPGEALALMLVLAAPPVYVYFACTEFKSLQENVTSFLKSVEQSQQDMEDFLAEKTKDMGLDNATVLALIVSWGLLLTGVMVWLILGWVLLSKKGGQAATLESQLGKLMTAGMTAFAGISKFRNQVKQTKEKLVASKKTFEKKIEEGKEELQKSIDGMRKGVDVVSSVFVPRELGPNASVDRLETLEGRQSSLSYL